MIGTAFFAEVYARGSLIISRDAIATARNILGSERLYRIGGVADLVNLACDIGVAVLLYRILRPAGQTLSLYAAFMRVAAAVCLAVATFFHFAPLLLLHGAPYLESLSTSQLQALAYESLRMHDLGYNISLVFFGVQLLAIGYLIVRSAIFPRLIGAFLLVAGGCYLVNSVTNLVVPEYGASVWLLVPGLLSELALAGWLLIRGVDPVRWQSAPANR